MSDVILIRPGCTDFDEQNRIQGALDLPLNPRGVQQVEEIARRLQDVPLEVIFTAPGEPARSTAAALGEALGVPVKVKDELRNLDQGLWQGLQLDDIRRKYPKVFKQWQDSPETICPPEGETVPEAVERIQKALRKPLKRKTTVGIVVSEPLATLICCVLKDAKPELPGSTCCADRPLVEFIPLNGLPAGTESNGETSANGSEPVPVHDGESGGNGVTR